jgi:hypothetical protein
MAQISLGHARAAITEFDDEQCYPDPQPTPGCVSQQGSPMANPYICESVNIVDNNFSADSRNKAGKRVVSFDNTRSLQLYLFTSHVLQIEAVVDSLDAAERGVITMSSGLRYITSRGAGVICTEMAKLAS